MKYLFKSLIAFTLLVAVSCEDAITELNTDPNNIPTAGDAQILTSSIGYLGYIQEVDLNFRSFLWSQHYTWGIGVSLGNAERFVAQPDDYDGYWQRAYANSLQDLHVLGKSESASYRGAAAVLKVYIYQGLVDHFGDVPFAEANLGEDTGNTSPVFDTDSDIYAELVTMLDDAITLLSENVSAMGADDVIYGGDHDSWIKFANSLKLRILMRQSETSPQGSAIQSLISSGTFIETEADMPQITYSGETGNQNPMFSRAEWGVGDFYFASNATLNVLSDLGDPRDEYFYSLATTGTSAGFLRGIDQGTIDDEPFTAPASDYSGSSAYAYADDNPVLLMSPWEVWFLRAEADVRYGTADDGVVAFETAVQSNFDYIGVPGGAAYLTSRNFASLTGDAAIDEIGLQKWISMNGTQEDEAWIETRRFDRPASRMFTDGYFQYPPLAITQGAYPATWLYPAQERSLNQNAPLQRAIIDRDVFWDN